MKFLITDDSSFMRAIVKKAVEPLHADFLEAENGEMAVSMYREHSPDIVFLDIIMPVKNGVMALQEIHEINPQAKVIMVTSVGQDEMIEKAKQLGASDFITKPFNSENMQNVVKKVMGI